MPLTAKIGSVDSRPGNIVPGLGAVIPASPVATPAQLLIEVAFAADPVTTAGYYFNVLNDGPVSEWRMDSQTLDLDQTGSGNHLTVAGTPTLTSSLVVGDTNQATIFNGTSQSAQAASTDGLSPTGPFSLELPVKTPASMPAGNRALAIKQGSYALYLTPAGRLIFQIKKGTTLVSITSGSVLSTSTTYFVALVYDGAKLLLYLNGVLDAQTNYSGGLDATMSPLLLARSDNSTASPTFRSDGFASNRAAGIEIGKPAGTVDGDYLVLFVQCQVPQQVATPAGWTLLGTTPTSTQTTLYAFGKVASGEPATYIVNADGTTALIASISAYSGVGAVPVGSVYSPPSVAGSSIVGASLPAYDNTLLVSCFTSYGSLSGSTWSESAGTERRDYGPSITASLALNTNPVGASALTQNTGTLTSSGVLQTIAVELVGPLTSTFTAATLDEVSFFSYGLSPAQVLNHYQQATTAPPTLVWTDITSDVRSVRISRGRQYELNRIEAGTASLLLKDTLRRYDPANSSSPYAPNVVPMRQIRIRAVFNSVTYPLFQGYVERWESVWEQEHVGAYAECAVTAVDGFEPLSLTAKAGTTQASLSGSSISNLLGSANWPAAARLLDLGAFQVAAIVRSASTSILDYIQQVAEGEGGIFFIDASGNAVFHDKNHRSTSTKSKTSQGLFGDQTLLALPYTGIRPSKDKDHIVNDWTVGDAAGGTHQTLDASSQLKFFRRSSSRSTLLSPADAATMADYLLALTAQPGYRIDELELCPSTNQNLWLQALQREISDRVTVQRQPVGITPGSTIVFDGWIERVEWTIVPQQPWRVKWQLSPAT